MLHWQGLLWQLTGADLRSSIDSSWLGLIWAIAQYFFLDFNYFSPHTRVIQIFYCAGVAARLGVIYPQKQQYAGYCKVICCSFAGSFVYSTIWLVKPIKLVRWLVHLDGPANFAVFRLNTDFDWLMTRVWCLLIGQRWTFADCFAVLQLLLPVLPTRVLTSNRSYFVLIKYVLVLRIDCLFVPWKLPIQCLNVLYVLLKQTTRRFWTICTPNYVLNLRTSECFLLTNWRSTWKVWNP